MSVALKSLCYVYSHIVHGNMGSILRKFISMFSNFCVYSFLSPFSFITIHFTICFLFIKEKQILQQAKVWPECTVSKTSSRTFSGEEMPKTGFNAEKASDFILGKETVLRDTYFPNPFFFNKMEKKKLSVFGSCEANIKSSADGQSQEF